MHISYDYAILSQGGSSSSTLVDVNGNIDVVMVSSLAFTVKRSIIVTKGSGGPF